MYIISKFKDYYDSSMGIDGIDKTCIYERTPKLIDETCDLVGLSKYFMGDITNQWTRLFSQDYRYGKTNNEELSLIKPFVVGFCGRTYVGHRFIWYKNLEITKSLIVFGPDEYFKQNPLDSKPDKYSMNKNYKKDLIEYFSQFHDKPNTDLFFKYQTPIFIFDFGTRIYPDLQSNNNCKGFIINPKLESYGFFRLFDSASAFQEIQMFIQGVLGVKEKNIIEISNNDKILQHGFDDKWSFRNPDPPKRKMNKL